VILPAPALYRPEEEPNKHSRLRDATVVSVLAYAGLRAQELLGLQWCHVRQRTILVEQAAVDGHLEGQKTSRPPRTVDLLAPFAHELEARRSASMSANDDALLFARPDGRIWREDDWRNWRKRVYVPAAEAVGIASPRGRTTCGTPSPRC
jgi:integrase